MQLASTITSARKVEHDLALGNILGSSQFNTLTVFVGYTAYLLSTTF